MSTPFTEAQHAFFRSVATEVKLADVDISDPQLPFAVGWVVRADGTAYALKGLYAHGLCLGYLYPELLEKLGLTFPTTHQEMLETTWIDPEDPTLISTGMRAWQIVDLHNLRKTPDILLALTMLPRVSKGSAAATIEQIKMIGAIMREAGYRHDTEIMTNDGDLPLRKLWAHLEKPE